MGSGGSFASVSNGGALHGETGGGGASPGIGQPGLIGSLVPVYSSARSAIDYFQNGSYWWGSLYVGMAALDVATLGGDSLFIDAAKVAARAINVTSKARTFEKALTIGEKFVGSEAKEVHPGVFRSSNGTGTRQFRMMTDDLTGEGSTLGPHVHFEKFDPVTGKRSKNIHTPISDP